MLKFVSNIFKVDDNIIKRLLAKHTNNCPKCKGRRIVYDKAHDPIHCTCWHQYNKEYQLYASNIPNEYHFKTKDDLFPEWRAQQNENILMNLGQYHKRIKDVRNDGFGLYLQGSKGSGASYIGAILLMHAIQNGMTAYFMQFRDFIDASIKGLRDPDINDDLNKLVSNIDFLLLDDVDSVPSAKTDIVQSIVPTILKKRSYARAPIIVTASGDMNKLQSVIGHHLASTLTERMSMLAFTGNVKRAGVKDLEREYFKTSE